MKLYLMRHGPAEDHADSGLDADRALSLTGRDRVRDVARLLVEVEEAPLYVMTSPLVRAVQTAHIVATLTKLHERGGTVQVREELAPAGDGARLVRALTQGGMEGALVVGHEPDLSSAAAALLGTFNRPFEKAMVVGADLPLTGGQATLRFVLDPRGLRLDPDSR